MEVQFSLTSFGALEVQIWAGKQHFRDLPSDVLNDFLAELVAALCLISQDEVEANVYFFCEPATYAFRFSPASTSGMAVLEVTLYENWNDAHREKKPATAERILIHEGSSRQIARTFWRALRKFETSVGADAYEAGARLSFPREGVERLGRLTKSG